MQDRQRTSNSQLRLAELVATLSLATDLGTGQPFERALRTCFLAVQLAQEAGLSGTTLSAVYYVALLRFVGCTADMQLLSTLFADEQEAQARVASLELLPSQIVTQILRYSGKGSILPVRIGKVLASLRTGMLNAYESGVAHCEVSQIISRRLGLDDEVTAALGQIFERWDGQGIPGAVKEEGLSIVIRIVHIAQDAEAFQRSGGAETAFRILRKRSGGYYDPTLVKCFCQAGTRWLAELDMTALWDAVIALDPQPGPVLDNSQLDDALRIIADFVDIRSIYTYGHSSAVAERAYASALDCGFSEIEAAQIRRAGFVHDIGRVAISLNIWDKPGSPTSAEWERIRLYPYYTERVLARVPVLAQIGTIAAAHRERLDGSGYHRGLPAPLIPRAARLLMAADVYQSKLEPRAYRSPLTAEGADAELCDQVRAGTLDSKAVDAVLAHRRGAPAHRRQTHPAGLSEREIEILRLLARGFSNRRIAELLSISPRTVEHHVLHVYNKAGVSTRIAATLFAIQHQLISPDETDIPS